MTLALLVCIEILSCSPAGANVIKRVRYASNETRNNVAAVFQDWPAAREAVPSGRSMVHLTTDPVMMASISAAASSAAKLVSEYDSDTKVSDPDSAALVSAAASAAASATDSTKAQPGQRPQRILIVCTQASGCTTFAKLLGQVDKTMVFMDTFIYVPTWMMPAPGDLNPQDAKYIVLKTTLQDRDVADPMDRLQQIKARFRPDRTILYVRHPVETFEHLKKHAGPKVDVECAPKPLVGWGYGSRCGSPEGKLRAMEVLWEQREDVFDAIVPYEALIEKRGTWDDIVWTMNSIGFPLERTHFQMSKNNREVELYARLRMGKSQFDWGTGDVVDGPIHPIAGEVPTNLLEQDETKDSLHLKALCPKLMGNADHFRATTVSSPPQLTAEGRAWFKQRINPSKQLILLFANSDYADTMLNWFAVGKGSGAVKDNYAIVCLDDTMEALLRAHGQDCFPIRPKYFKRLDGSLYALGPLWMVRVRLVQALLQDGIDVVLSDSDALWLKDPLPDLDQIAASSGADIISSRGRSPDNAAKAWGATACMGFIYLRSTPSAQEFVQEMLAFAKKSMVFDDQILLNTLLVASGLKFPQTLKFEDSTEADVGVTTRPFAQSGSTSHVTVALLPHHKYMRICSEKLPETAVVAHCLSMDKYGSTGEAKREELANQGLWVIPERWPSSHSELAFAPWIQSLVTEFTTAMSHQLPS